MLELISADVTNHPRTHAMISSFEDRETAVVVPRTRECLQLVSQTLDSVPLVDSDNINISVHLRDAIAQETVH
jgi:hypothetical protein